MPFEQGHEKLGGRAKGVPNKNPVGKVRAALMEIVAEYVCDDLKQGVKTLKADLATLRPVDRAAIIEKYARYVLPTLSSVNLETDPDNPMTIRVVYEALVPVDEDKEDADDKLLDYSEEI